MTFTPPAAMGCPWMTQKEVSQAIPPAYTEWIGAQLLAAIAHRPVENARPL